MLKNGTVRKSRFPTNMIAKYAESRSAQVDDFQWQILHLDVTLVGVLSEHCQPKCSLFMKLSGVNAPCISAVLDAGETPRSLGILKSFSSRGGLSSGRCRSWVTVVSNRSKEPSDETRTSVSSSAHILQQRTRVTCIGSRCVCADRQKT